MVMSAWRRRGRRVPTGVGIMRAFLPSLLLAAVFLAAAPPPDGIAQTFLLHDKGLDRRGYRGDEGSHLYRLRLEPDDVVVLDRYRTRYGEPGRKLREGDGRTPEGKYRIVEVRRRERWEHDRFGPWSLRLSYPNAYDRRRPRPGGNILLHGGRDSITHGCIRVLDDGYRTFGSENITVLAGRTPEGTPILSAPHVPRFLKDRPGKRLGREAAALYRDLLRRELDNEAVIAGVAGFDPYRTPQGGHAPLEAILFT